MSRRSGWLAVLCATAFALPARAEDALQIPPSDHIESVQNRAWIKRGSFMLEPLGAYAFNDPFIIRGGGGLRAVYWLRSLVGFSVSASGWAQSPSEQARIAQRELRAQLRPTGSTWSALAGAEVTPVDGKIAFFSAIVPFEMFLTLGLGAASSREAIDSSPVFAVSAGLGVRWFITSRVGIDTALTWQSASITRFINGGTTSARDTLVSFGVGIPVRIGGAP